MWAEHLILIASVVAGAATVLIGKLDQPRHLKLLTAFTGAYLMGLTCLHLSPTYLRTPNPAKRRIGSSAHSFLADSSFKSCSKIFRAVSSTVTFIPDMDHRHSA